MRPRLRAAVSAAVRTAGSAVGAMEKRDPRKVGYGLLQQLKLLGDQLLELRGQSRHVSAGACEALHEPQGDRVGQDDKDNGNRAGRPLRRADRGSAGQHDDIDLGLHELGDEGREPIGVPFRPAILDRHVLAFDPAQLAQASTERLQLRDGTVVGFPLPRKPITGIDDFCARQSPAQQQDFPRRADEHRRSITGSPRPHAAASPAKTSVRASSRS